MGTYQLPKINAEKRISYALAMFLAGKIVTRRTGVPRSSKATSCRGGMLRTFLVRVTPATAAVPIFDNTTPTTFRFKHSGSLATVSWVFGTNTDDQLHDRLQTRPPSSVWFLIRLCFQQLLPQASIIQSFHPGRDFLNIKYQNNAWMVVEFDVCVSLLARHDEAFTLLLVMHHEPLFFNEKFLWPICQILEPSH